MADLSVALKPDKIVAIEDEFKTQIVEFENKSHQKMARWSSPRSKYKLQWTMADSTKLALIRAFFTARLGRYGNWTINDARIGSGDILVEFATDKLKVDPVKFVYFNIEAEIQTC